jgi:AAA family ATP:ADP antiporter
LRTIKEAVFFDLVGADFLPKARIITPLILIGMLFIFNLIVSSVKKESLFAIVACFYASIFFAIALALQLKLPTVDHCLVNWIPGKLVGWILYWSIESFGSIIVGAVFWAFVSNSTKTESAKRGFPMIFLFGQVGQLLGAGLVTAFAISSGKVMILVFSSGLILLIPILMKFYTRNLPESEAQGDGQNKNKKKQTSAIEGLRLIVTKPFLAGVAIVTTIYEIVGTIMEYQFYVISSLAYPVAEEFASFLGFFSTSTAIISIFFSIFGTGYFLRNLGVSFSLLAFPSLLALTVFFLIFKPTIWAFFVSMIIFKSLNYTLNNPVKELLYLPTSTDIKYKAKSFIDGLGSRMTKSMGSIINDGLKENKEQLFIYGSLVSMGVIGLWALVAVYVGKKYNQLIEKDEILE